MAPGDRASRGRQNARRRGRQVPGAPQGGSRAERRGGPICPAKGAPMKILPLTPAEVQLRPSGAFQPPMRGFDDMLGSGAATATAQPCADRENDETAQQRFDLPATGAGVVDAVAALIQAATRPSSVADELAVQA